ncbi:hypothetical protein ABMA27_009087 [Loxostege sticticalis]|uniref:Tigger transposable element-derived protein 4 n=1 Tax=Loxostege sticticalis TaxID=481309 RepID=A0ABR3H9W5_LOXSC
MSQNKRKVFSIEEKSHIIWRLENGESNSEIAKECGVSHSTISTIWKNRDKIKVLFENNSLKLKRARASEHKVIEDALLTWFKHQRTNNVPISGPILQQKANDFARLMGKENFECSSSWVQRFRARHNIVAGKVCGEAAGVPEGVSEEWLSHKWPALCEGYTPEEIFNADETGLFYNLTPDKTLKFKGEECKGGKLFKTRITVLVAANMTGSCKRKLLVIGKAKKPRCFKNIQSLPVTYKNNTRSWMTSQIFEKWLLDKCPAHPVVSNLKCIKLVFLPPNVTSVLQPMDQGVIKALKTQYRKLQVLQMIQNIENSKPINSLSVLDAILMISEAWEKVTQTTIANCFRHAGFNDLSSSQAEDDDDIPLARLIQFTDEDDNVPLAELVTQLQRFTASEQTIQIAEFVGIDDSVAVCALATEEEILAEAESNNRNTDEENEDLQNPEEQFQPTTISEALNAVTVLQKFVAFNDQFDSDDAHVLRSMKRKMQRIFETGLKKKQTKMTDYIKK